MAAGDVRTVTLIDRNGIEVNVSSPVEVTNLVYGQGYSIKGSKTADEAAAHLADALQPEQPPTKAATTTTTTAKA